MVDCQGDAVGDRPQQTLDGRAFFLAHTFFPSPSQRTPAPFSCAAIRHASRSPGSVGGALRIVFRSLHFGQ